MGDDFLEIVGVTHPIPPEYAKRIYNKGKTVFVGKRCLCKVKKGDKFVIYQSHDLKAYAGWADIKYIGKIKTNAVMRKYGEKLIVTREEFNEYSRKRNEMFVIEFENFEKFQKPVKPKGYFVTVAGKYINNDEYEFIEKNRG